MINFSNYCYLNYESKNPHKYWSVKNNEVGYNL